MINILDGISNIDTQTQKIMFDDDYKKTVTKLNRCPICGGCFKPVAMIDDYNVLCKCEECGLAVFK